MITLDIMNAATNEMEGVIIIDTPVTSNEIRQEVNTFRNDNPRLSNNELKIKIIGENAYHGTFLM